MIKKILLIFIALTFTFLPLTGCWDRKELNEIGIVIAMGIDKENENGKYVVTSQVINPSPPANTQSKNSPTELVTASGDSLFEAVRNNAKKFDRLSYFAHVRILVVSDKVAQEGIKDVIDFLIRAHQLRNNIWFMVSQNKEAREVLAINCGIEDIQAYHLEGIIKGKKLNTEISSSILLDIVKKIQGNGINPTTEAFKVVDEKSEPEWQGNAAVKKCVRLSDTAVFNKDKLVGYLNNVETRGFNMIMGNTKSTAIRVPSNKNENEYISIDVRKVKSHIKPQVLDEKISFIVTVKVQGNIFEVPDNTNVSELEEFYKVNDKFKKATEHDVNKTLVKIQKELKSDILGFGSSLYTSYPKEWKKVKEQWDKDFVNVPYTVKVETHLNRTGLILKPAHVIEK
ncbi:Ger(x)C family spore germination protein [Clostridium magnum]|uniref:Spore germination protein B3 n=1 Tax=Clostridium magnum DSM 2767 TaxID=1121326 RepID=A0A161XBK0_9CLOT|nr:Ger(x)C family spore germination protein [Clostridium magnum]KZL91656.1 spore germination protein B3 precursor [Clostridium magnum DSM 2767]SHH51272.1 spore germination protein KC [Clostridium magnum DSM 2767]